MCDISGNGFHATWSAAPTKTAHGVTFNGAAYADVPIMGKGVDVTVYGMVSFNDANGRPLMSNREQANAGAAGTGVKATFRGDRQPATVIGGASNSTNASPIPVSSISATAWCCHAWKFHRSEKIDLAWGEAINLATGESFFTVSSDAHSDRAWRIGAEMIANGTILNLLQSSAKAGGLIFIDGLTSRAQDAAAYAYFQDVAAARVIALV